MIQVLGFYRNGKPATDLTLPPPGELPSDKEILHTLQDLYHEAAKDDDPSTFLWVGLFHPTEHEMLEVAKIFDFSDLEVEDALLPRQRARVEESPEQLFALLRVLRSDMEHDKIDGGQIAIFSRNDVVITVRSQGSGGSVLAIRDRLETEPEMLSEGPLSVVYTVADSVVDEYLHVAEYINQEMEDIEETIFNPTQDTNVNESIYRLKRRNLRLRRAINPLIHEAVRLRKNVVQGLPPKLQPYYSDLGDNLLRIHDYVDTNDELLMTLLMASATVEDVKQNDTMRKISAWVGMAAIPTMLAGIYGMNFENMPELKWEYGYYLVLAVMIGSIIFLYTFFKKHKWL